ncbi:MAG TPA: hypothetical protein VFF04_00535 [Candidatus Babeliales bacterium]|nr:hypothetical protein [Candidatus Babeliales bacterium]
MKIFSSIFGAAIVLLSFNNAHANMNQLINAIKSNRRIAIVATAFAVPGTITYYSYLKLVNSQTEKQRAERILNNWRAGKQVYPADEINEALFIQSASEEKLKKKIKTDALLFAGIISVFTGCSSIFVAFPEYNRNTLTRIGRTRSGSDLYSFRHN